MVLTRAPPPLINALAGLSGKWGGGVLGGLLRPDWVMLVLFSLLTRVN